MFVLFAGSETYRSLWAKMVRNAAHVACAALNEVREENSKQRVPPIGTFEVGSQALCVRFCQPGNRVVQPLPACVRPVGKQQRSLIDLWWSCFLPFACSCWGWTTSWTPTTTHGYWKSMAHPAWLWPTTTQQWSSSYTQQRCAQQPRLSHTACMLSCCGTVCGRSSARQECSSSITDMHLVCSPALFCFFSTCCIMQGSMVSDMFNMLDVQHRFLPLYGLSKSGSKLSAMQAQRARIALSRHSEAAAKARVDAELQNRGGFIPLMGHFPVMQMQAAVARGSNGAGDTQQAADAEQGTADGASSSDDDGDMEQQPAGVGGVVQQAAAGNQAAAAGVHFTDADKRLFVYMQQWWQKHRAAGKRRRKRLKVAPAAAVQPPEEPAAMQVDEQPPSPS